MNAKYKTGRRYPNMNYTTEKRFYETGSRLVWDSDKGYLGRGRGHTGSADRARKEQYNKKSTRNE